MRISLNWLKRIVKIPVSDEELIRLIGARLVEVEGVIDETHKYDNIYVVEVKTCKKIPDTHLTLCQIDVGSKELVQVVCGAPNVREGMLAVWIAPGAIVPVSVHEDAPFVIGKRKMQGYESCGMLAGADELDFGDDHSGIVEIDPSEAKPGDLLADIFELDDLILEIENKSLTHRPDTFGIIGFSREVSGILGESFVETPFSDQDAAVAKVNADCKITIESSDICPRYSAIIMEKHGEAKKKYLSWMDTILSKSGMRPVDFIVDITNYLMLLTGQPLHAFDYDKFVEVGGDGKLEINVRLARVGEKITLIDDKEVELNENDIVICSGSIPVALAGAMGGKSTQIDENTRKIIIESATFSLYNLRKTQMAHGIFSEAITRFTKGQPAYQTLMVAEECSKMLSSGFKGVGMVDNYPQKEKSIVIEITADEINELLGTEYERDLIVRTLSNTGFQVSVLKHKVNRSHRHGFRSVVSKDLGSEVLEIIVPKWRTDIHIKEDIIEEVGRLLGYDNIKPTLPLHGTATKNMMFDLKRKVRGLMMKYGANEVLTYSFVSGRLLNKVGLKENNSYRIINSISPELQYVRQSIVPSLLEKSYMNQKLPVDRFAIYEINKVYQKEWGMNDEGVPVEKMHLGFVMAERKNNETAYYKAKKYIAKLLSDLNVRVEFLPFKCDGAETKPFEPKRSAMIVVDGNECIGIVGEFRNSVRSEFKLAPYLAGFEIDLEKTMTHIAPEKKIFVGNKEKRDLTVVTNESYADLVKRIEKVIEEEGARATITPIGIYRPDEATEKRISVHLEFTSFNENVMKKLESL